MYTHTHTLTRERDREREREIQQQQQQKRANERKKEGGEKKIISRIQNYFPDSSLYHTQRRSAARTKTKNLIGMLLKTFDFYSQYH